MSLVEMGISLVEMGIPLVEMGISLVEMGVSISMAISTASSSHATTRVMDGGRVRPASVVNLHAASTER